MIKLSDKDFVEGYWKNDTDCKNYQLPVDSGKEVNEEFLQNLERVIIISAQRREVVLEKKRNIVVQFVDYMGYSNCRLCQKENGSGEYIIVHDGVKYRFPEGIVHYYKEHRVQPSHEFQELIMNLELIVVERIDISKINNNDLFSELYATSASEEKWLENYLEMKYQAMRAMSGMYGLKFE